MKKNNNKVEPLYNSISDFLVQKSAYKHTSNIQKQCIKIKRNNINKSICAYITAKYICDVEIYRCYIIYDVV